MNSFLKFYVIGRTEIDLFGIAHVTVEFILILKIFTIRILGRFVWTSWSTHFVQCDRCWLTVLLTFLCEATLWKQSVTLVLEFFLATKPLLLNSLLWIFFYWQLEKNCVCVHKFAYFPFRYYYFETDTIFNKKKHT